jgi:3-isopropylmalate/(R)-2-methylmalate dehydratase small subunit
MGLVSQPFTTHSGICAPLPRADVDTDQIIPKQFLKRVERSGFGQYLFHDWRFDDAGATRLDFVLNRPEYRGATILIAGRNFGCGSSREHAAWSLLDYGFRCVIAPSFADIFRQNADQNGLATVELREAIVRELLDCAQTRAPCRLTVDLKTCRIGDGAGLDIPFQMDPFRRTCLREGLDQIGLTLKHEDAIRAYESTRRG